MLNRLKMTTTMSPDIQKYYWYLCGEVEEPPGPINLPEGFTPQSLAKIIFQTLLKKATMLDDLPQVKILFSAWAILNDAYEPVSCSDELLQTDSETGLDRPVAASNSATQTDVSAGAALAKCDSVSQTDAAEPALHMAIQAGHHPLLHHTTSQTEDNPQPSAVRECASQTAAPAVVTARATQTRPARTRHSSMQTMLPTALAVCVATQTAAEGGGQAWLVAELAGARPPPAVRSAKSRRFHGRRLRRGDDPPLAIPLLAEQSCSVPPVDPRTSLASGSGCDRTASESTGSSYSSGLDAHTHSSSFCSEEPGALLAGSVSPQSTVAAALSPADGAATGRQDEPVSCQLRDISPLGRGRTDTEERAAPTVHTVDPRLRRRSECSPPDPGAAADRGAGGDNWSDPLDRRRRLWNASPPPGYAPGGGRPELTAADLAALLSSVEPAGRRDDGRPGGDSADPVTRRTPADVRTSRRSPPALGREADWQRQAAAAQGERRRLGRAAQPPREAADITAPSSDGPRPHLWNWSPPADVAADRESSDTGTRRPPTHLPDIWPMERPVADAGVRPSSAERHPSPAVLAPGERRWRSGELEERLSAVSRQLLPQLTGPQHTADTLRLSGQLGEDIYLNYRSSYMDSLSSGDGDAVRRPGATAIYDSDMELESDSDDT